MSSKILLENGKIKPETDFGDLTTQQDLIRSLVNRASQSGSPLVVHFHGGLVNKVAGIEVANRLQNEYEAAGGIPLFFVWQSGFLETIKINYREALDGKLVKWALKKIIGKLGEKLNVSPHDLTTRSTLVQMGADTEFTQQDLQRLQAELEIDAEFNAIARDLVSAVNSELGSTIPDEKRFRSLLNSSHQVNEQSKREASTIDPTFFVEEGEEEGTRGLISLAAFKLKVIKAVGATIIGVIKRYLNHTDHGMPATAIEELSRRIHGDEIGAKIWGFMKKDTADSFKAGDEYAGSFLLQCLENAPTRPRIILVGHSAGAVFICNLLANAQQGPFDVALLAPAATYELFDKTISDHGAKIGGFRMYTMYDSKERDDNLVNQVPWLYPSSLLYLISGILEKDNSGKPDIDKPILGMERFYDSNYQGRPGDAQLIARVRSFIDAEPNRVVWSITQGMAGMSTASCDHGYFDEDPDTVASLRHLISTGY